MNTEKTRMPLVEIGLICDENTGTANPYSYPYDIIDKVPLTVDITAMMLVSAYEAIIDTIEESKQNEFEKEFMKSFKKYMKSRFDDLDKKNIDNNNM